MDELFEIFIDDLNPECRKRLLEFLEMTEEQVKTETNWDIHSITEVPKPEPQ
jgi:hypothetical protein